MKTNHILTNQLAAVTLLSLLAFQPQSAPAAGSLTPPGAPAPLMKTLQEIEPRTLIASVPYIISAPGSYYLSNNLTVATGNAITIQANGVTLDLNGFTLSSTAASATGTAILINGAYSDITIFNGHIVSGVTDNGSGSFSGPGFASGIYDTGGSSANVRVSNVSVSGVLNYGIWINYTGSSVVEGCTVKTSGAYGIIATTVKSCSAYNCGSYAIYATLVSDSYGQSYDVAINGNATTVINSYGYSINSYGIMAYNVENCYGYSLTSLGVYAYETAINCYGYGGGSYGLYAVVANNCYGSTGTTNSYGICGYNLNNCYGYGGSAGVCAYDTAHGCYGTSYYGNGVSAKTAENCVGYTYASGTYSTPYAGVSATVAHNCYGYGYDTSSYTYGIDASAANNCYGYSYYSMGCYIYPGTAENCFGSSTNYLGIYANAANNCYGTSLNSYGMYAMAANNCYGVSQNDDGLDAVTANNCYGYSYNGYYGIYTGLANNCYGYCDTTGSGTGGTGVYAYGSANNCYGVNYRNSGTGLYADLSIGCRGYEGGTSSVGLSAFIGESSTGSGTTPLSVTHNLNCY